MKSTLITLTLISFSLSARITGTRTSFTTEEHINDTHFKHTTIISNGIHSASYHINGIPAEAASYEEALLNAEREQSKQRRLQAEKERIRTHELLYQGEVRIQQTSIKKATDKLVGLLRTALDSNLEHFRAYTPESIASQEVLIDIAEKLLPQAKELYLSSPKKVHLALLHEVADQLEKQTALLRTFVNDSIENGIHNAHDTKLLKELLALAGTV